MKTLTARSASPPNMAVLRLTSVPNANVVTACSLSLTKVGRQFGVQNGGGSQGGVPAMQSRLAWAAVQSQISWARRKPRSGSGRREGSREGRRGNDVPRKDVALRGRQAGGDRHIGFRHRAKHRLHGGRMPLHPLQPFACVNRHERWRSLGASAVELPSGVSHRVCESPPGFRLACFGGDASFEIGELGREESASLRAWRAVF